MIPLLKDCEICQVTKKFKWVILGCKQTYMLETILVKVISSLVVWLVTHWWHILEEEDRENKTHEAQKCLVISEKWNEIRHPCFLKGVWQWLTLTRISWHENYKFVWPCQPRLWTSPFLHQICSNEWGATTCITGSSETRALDGSQHIPILCRMLKQLKGMRESNWKYTTMFIKPASCLFSDFKSQL